MKYVAILIVFFATGCYRMPEDGEVSTLPDTNNPNITRHKEKVLMPGFEY